MDFDYIFNLTKDYPVLPLLTIGVTAIGMLIKVAKNIFQFYDEYVLHRSYRKIADLEKYCEKDSILSKFLRQEIEAEIFRVTTGINTSQAKAEALMNFHLTGKLSLTKLKRLSRYLSLNGQSKLEIDISTWESYLAEISLIVALFLIALGFIMTMPFFISGKLTLLLAGFLLFGVIILFAVFISSDYRDYKNLKTLDLNFKAKNKSTKEKETSHHMFPALAEAYSLTVSHIKCIFPLQRK